MKSTEFEELTKDCDNIIFDYGGIFVDIYHQDTIDSFIRLASSDSADKLYGKHGQTKLFSRLEVGEISPMDFLDELRSVLGSKASNEELVKAWCAMLKGIPKERVDFLQKLGTKKRVFMLSNINQIHEDFLAEMIHADPDLKDFYSSFEKVYFSHRIGRRKPDREAFEMVIEENGLDRSRTAFMDDTQGHVDAAISFGLKGVLLDPPNCFITKV